MAHCYQLSINEREEISLGLAQGFSKNYIALLAGHLVPSIAKSTVTLQTGKFTERLKLIIVLIS